MKQAMIDNTIAKHNRNTRSSLFAQRPLLEALVDVHQEYMRGKDPLTKYCRSGKSKSGTWKVSAKHAGNKVNWRMVFNDGVQDQVCNFTGRTSGSTRMSLPHVPKPQLPAMDRLRTSNYRGRTKALLRRKPAIVSRPQLPKKDRQRENTLKLLAPAIAAACHARIYQ